MTTEHVHGLRAIEALRAGVPNRDVVRAFPPSQKDVELRWQAALERAGEGETAPGILLEGDFGTGKSHWMARLRHEALEANFVVSSIVLNKETPLHDLTKLLRAAVENAALPERSGPALSEIAHLYNAEVSPGHTALLDWVRHPERDPRLALTLLIFERTRDEDVQMRAVAEWMGYPMATGDLKLSLREIGEKISLIPKPLAGSAPEKFEFLARFFRAAGYAGWVLLLDETEMVSKYSQRQRGRAYAHLAQLSGAVKGGIPGLVCAATITKDYAGQVLHGRKNDAVLLPAKMENSRDEHLIAATIAGMKWIERGGLDLRPLTREGVENLFESARKLYSQAYNWQAPPLPNRREYSSSTSLRQHLRWWINAWDLLRLYHHEGETIVENVAISYEEDADLQSQRAEDESQIVL